ncbi:ABC-F family ATP-binding cassette domain-containing protein [candidate division KSB1 bacterium]|nr:ABC-F family ATP-binding cassette domain-containing protein [candidate division KSB1 bacterium]
MLHLKGITYTVGDRELLRNIDLVIPDNKRFALIGANGAGKTTLLKIIAGELPTQGGVILRSTKYRIGYLPQEEILLESNNILHYILKGREDLLDLEEQIQQLRHELSDSASNPSHIGDKLATLEHQFEHLGGYKLESDAKAILAGLGFKVSDYERPIQELSGGWRMRVYLARLLLQQPNLLLLDEPTNHLDLASLEWLEDYLQNCFGSIVVVSHDRFFIDRIAQEIFELKFGKLNYYAGNYHFYEEQKLKNKQLLYKKAEHLKKEKQKQQEFIDRFRYKNTKARQVQSRIKMLENLEDIDIEPEEQQLSFQLSVTTSSYKDVLVIENMSFRYAEEWVFSDVNFALYRGQKIALVGDNGAGKTTLTRLIVKQRTPQRGRITLGQRVNIGYYAQHQLDALDINSTVYQAVADSVANSQLPNIRTVLGLFGISGDDVYKKIGVLSGGEKARVSLTKILLSPVNFLIMDEPTNHLDIRSREALENALATYDGTLILISHDRYFLDKIVEKVVEIRHGQFFEYAGNYTDYLQKRGERSIDLRSEQQISKGSKKAKDNKRKEAEARQAISKKRNELQQTIFQLEASIEELEKRKSEVEALLADPESYKKNEFAASLTKEYHQVKDKIESDVREWELTQEELEKLLENANISCR